MHLRPRRPADRRARARSAGSACTGGIPPARPRRSSHEMPRSPAGAGARRRTGGNRRRSYARNRRRCHRPRDRAARPRASARPHSRNLAPAAMLGGLPWSGTTFALLHQVGTERRVPSPGGQSRDHSNAGTPLLAVKSNISPPPVFRSGGAIAMKTLREALLSDRLNRAASELVGDSGPDYVGREMAAGLSTGGDDAAAVGEGRATPLTEVVVQILDAEEPIAVVYLGFTADAGNPSEHPHRALHGSGRGRAVDRERAVCGRRHGLCLGRIRNETGPGESAGAIEQQVWRNQAPEAGTRRAQQVEAVRLA